MKFRRKTRSYKNIPKRYYISHNGTVYDYGPIVNTFAELPPKGHPKFIYKVLDQGLYYVWNKQRGRFTDVTKKTLMIRVRPMSRNQSKSPSLFAHLTNLPILVPLMNYSSLEPSPRPRLTNVDIKGVAMRTTVGFHDKERNS